MKYYVAILSVITLISCGPRRYKCGPYRRCEVKEQKKHEIVNSNLHKLS